MIKNVYQSLCNVSIFLCDINQTFDFFRMFLKQIFKNQISRKSVQFEPSCSMRTDRRTGKNDEGNSFRNFAKAHKNYYLTKSNSPVLHITNFLSAIY
jgi:hypothetical protein